MNVRRLAVLFVMFGIILSAGGIFLLSPNSTATSFDPTGDDGLLAAQDDALLPCGAFEEVRTIQPPEPTPVAPTNTPDPNAATPTAPPPTATPRPAPSEDRVGFPENYATEFKLLFVFDRPDRRLVRAICGNEIAAQRQDGEPFAYGSVLLMISYSAKIGSDGQPVLDENGHYIGERLVALHVQRKEPGFGEAYGEDQAGEWEFIAFNGDGSYQNTAETTNFCAACHLHDGGESVDYVFRMNLFHDGEAALIAPVVDENATSIYLYGFHEPVLEVKVGTTVTWVNNDQATHNVVAAVTNAEGKLVAAEEPLFASPALPSVNIEGGASFSFTFEEPGEYLYLCSLHANEIGRIIVTE
jgi:plastocyanin